MASRAQSSSVPPRSFKGLDKRELAKGVGVFTLLFTIVVGAARHTAATSEEKENSAVMYKRQMQALDAVERSARAFTHPGSDPDALPWDEAKLGQYLRRARLVPSYVGLNGGLDPPSFDGPVSWTSVIMGKNWSSVMVRDKLKRAYSNAKQDMPLFGTGREMSHDDEADELERLQQAQMDDEQYAERLFAAYEALEEKRAKEAAEAARLAAEAAARESEDQRRLQVEAKERQAAQLRNLAKSYEKAEMRESASEPGKQQADALQPQDSAPSQDHAPVPAPPAPTHVPEAPHPPPLPRTYF